MCTQFGLLVEVVKMTAPMFVVIVFLLSVSEVISECPPSSGKTLDVYNDNCIGFYRYLPEHREDCHLINCIFVMKMSTQKIIKNVYHVFYLVLV